MLILLSPAKSLDFTPLEAALCYTQPAYLDEAACLIASLRRKSACEIAALMDLSDTLARLNVERYAQWQREHVVPTAKPALLAFAGDVYEGLGASSLPPSCLGEYLQRHLGILSGLYGLLRPLDLILPYRLEMGTRLPTERGDDLYTFWGERIREAISARLEALGSGVVVNLASQEYARAARLPALVKAGVRVVTPVFEERRNGAYKIISFSAKRARGAMLRFAALHRLNQPEALQTFGADGYVFDAAASDASTWRFRREHHQLAVPPLSMEEYSA